MELIYQNFDGLDVTFQGIFPEELLHELEMARQQAENNRGCAPVAIKLGKCGVPVHVAESGMRGGYRYRFDTGYDGETWCIGNSNDPEQWNIRISVKSLALALYGYKGVKNRIYDLFEKFGATGPIIINSETGEINDLPKEAISRIDYCFDFKSLDFKIDPNCIIAHSRCKRDLLQTIQTGRNIVYCRIGTMPNKQIVIYDKIREIKESTKPYWWDIWNIEEKEFNQKIWRVEIRAGKKELKNWNLRTFDDLENKFGDVLLAIIKEIKYVSPNSTDSNSNRWPIAPFWKVIQKAAKNTLSEYISNAKKGQIISEYREILRERYRKQIEGMIPGYAVISGKDDAAQIPGVLEDILTGFSDAADKNKTKMKYKIKKAKDKFIFLNNGGNIES